MLKKAGFRGSSTDNESLSDSKQSESSLGLELRICAIPIRIPRCELPSDYNNLMLLFNIHAVANLTYRSVIIDQRFPKSSENTHFLIDIFAELTESLPDLCYRHFLRIKQIFRQKNTNSSSKIPKNPYLIHYSE